MSSTVAAAEVSKDFGAYQEAALREPVIITAVVRAPCGWPTRISRGCRSGTAAFSAPRT